MKEAQDDKVENLFEEIYEKGITKPNVQNQIDNPIAYELEKNIKSTEKMSLSLDEEVN